MSKFGYLSLRSGLWVAIFCAFMAGMDIKYVAHLARLALTPEEEEKLGAQLGNILHYIEKLNQLDVSNVEPTFSTSFPKMTNFW